MVNILLVDDHRLVRAGIMRILNDAPGIKVIGDVDSGEEAIRFVRQISRRHVNYLNHILL